MRETPPYSLAEIRLLLVQYLDGALEPERMVAVDELLAQFPDYQAEFLKLQSAHGKVHEVLERQAEESLLDGEPGSLWEDIASRLQADRAVGSIKSFSPEWISSYIDGEIPRHDPDREAFESQLASNEEESRLLAGLTQVSESVKQFGARLENACTVDVSQAVMAAFQAEQAGGQAQVAGDILAAGDILDEATPVNTEWELLSAFTDQELAPRDIIQATQLIESSDTARANLAKLNRLSEQIQRVGLQMEAPTLWPRVEAALQALPDDQKIVPLSRAKRRQWLLRAAIPIAATLLLGLFSFPSLHWGGVNTPAANKIASAAAASQDSLQAEEAQPAGSQELATVPVSARKARAEDMTPSADSDGLNAMVDEMTAQPAAAPAALNAAAPNASGPAARAASLKPMLEASPAEMADTSVGSSQTALPANDAAPRKSPTSEAYLFDALNRQMPDDDISNILGK